MEIDSKEKQIELVLKIYKKGQFKTLQSMSWAFDIPWTTLQQWMEGITL